MLRRRLRRGQVLEFCSRQPCCVVAMEACSGAYFRGRDGNLEPPGAARSSCLGQALRERRKDDMADAEAIGKAALRATMRFAALRSEDTKTQLRCSGCASF